MAPPTSRTYRNSRAAAVLLFKTITNISSIRFIAHSIAWELSDDSYVGPDPAGLIFYDDNIFDVVVRDPTPAQYRVEQFYYENERCVRIYFFKPGSTTDYFGEFVAFDLHDRAGQSGIVGPIRNATWRRQNYTTIPMTIVKPAASQIIKIESETECEINSGTSLSGYAINNVRVNLTAKRSRDLGNFVRWHKDRAVFHSDSNPNTRDFNSFLFPDDERKDISSRDDLAWWVTWKYPA